MSGPGSPTAERLVIGIDVGGTKTLSALVRLTPTSATHDHAEVVDRHEGPSSAGSSDAIEVISAGSHAMVDAASSRNDGSVVEVVGVGLAGFLDLDGVITASPNAPGLVGVDIQRRLAAELGIPVVTENDANCVAVAAHHLVAPDSRHLVAVTLGTGIGGGLIVDGELVRGANGFAGEPGHMVVDPNGPPCPCGGRGCWERFASGSGLAYLGRKAASAGEAPALLAAAGSVEAIRGQDVTALLAAAHPDVDAVFAEFIHYLAVGVANLIMLLDPEVIVIGGGLIDLGDRLIDALKADLADGFPAATTHRPVRIECSPGGAQAGALGAALTAARRLNG